MLRIYQPETHNEPKRKGSDVLGETKPQAAAPVAWPDPVAARRAHGPRNIAPGATADHSRDTVTRYPRTAIRGSPFVAVVPAILDPLPDITWHVVQTKAVRLKAAHWSPFPCYSTILRSNAAS